MRYGISLRQMDRSGSPDDLVAVAEVAERLQFDSLWQGDHVVIPRVFDGTLYQYRAGLGGEFPRTNQDNIFEPITTYCFVAGKVSTPKLGLATLVVPYRNPVLTAKMLANLDILSGGRLVLGVGTGWMKEEFEALGSPPWEDRGSVTNEYLDLFIELWTKDEVDFRGQHYQVSGVGLLPKPVQKPYPPIWVGGHTRRAYQRLARYGVGWQPHLLTPQDIARELPRLGRICREAGRNPDEIETSVSASVRFGWSGSGDRPPLAGTSQQIADDVLSYQEVGVSEIRLRFEGDTVSQVVDNCRRFAEEVRPKV